LFTEAYNKVATVGSAVKGFMCSEIRSLPKDITVPFNSKKLKQDGNVTENNHSTCTDNDCDDEHSQQGTSCFKKNTRKKSFERSCLLQRMEEPKKKKHTEFNKLDFR
jgi:hypothetical protein